MQSAARAVRGIRPGFTRRSFATSTSIRSAWSTGPAPPRLPKEDQEIFDKLQQESTGAFSTPKPAAGSPEQKAESAAAIDVPSDTRDMLEQLRAKASLPAKGDGEELHPNIRRGAPPEFEGEKNPKTGEVGGPKNEPLRWGSTANAGDWSYNGRVTDF